MAAAAAAAAATAPTAAKPDIRKWLRDPSPASVTVVVNTNAPAAAPTFVYAVARGHIPGLFFSWYERARARVREYDFRRWLQV